jgi:hypothetical protein
MAPVSVYSWSRRDQTLGPWAKGDGPSGLRAARIGRHGEVAVASLYQVFGRQPGGVHALAFFDGCRGAPAMAEAASSAPYRGATSRESDLPGRHRSSFALQIVSCESRCQLWTRLLIPFRNVAGRDTKLLILACRRLRKSLPVWYQGR